jgi:hypothetical protein
MTGGYAHPLYARASEDQGKAFELPRSGGWLLRRQVSGGTDEDAAGCYPLFACRDWSGLPADLAALGEDLVTVVLVADPLGDHEGVLPEAFPHLERFKEHFIVELDRYEAPSRHHRREAHRARGMVTVERCPEPSLVLDDWNRLYGQLIERHGIEGPAAFTAESFRLQFQVPGLVTFRALHEDRTVAMALWFVQGGAAYYHLAASDPAGYETGASYALLAAAIEHFEGRVECLDLGGAPGLDDAGGHGLRDFKEGWATGSRWAYLCGRVLNEERYEALVGRAADDEGSGFFPAYRDPRGPGPRGDSSTE